MCFSCAEKFQLNSSVTVRIVKAQVIFSVSEKIVGGFTSVEKLKTLRAMTLYTPVSPLSATLTVRYAAILAEESETTRGHKVTSQKNLMMSGRNVASRGSLYYL